MRILHKGNDFPWTDENINITPGISDIIKCYELQKILTPGGQHV